MKIRRTIMENLNALQKDYLRGQIGRAKFVDLAEAAGCMVGQVRQFATVVFEERKRAADAQWARAQAEAQANAKRDQAQWEAKLKLIGKTEDELQAEFEEQFDEDALREKLYDELNDDNREFLMEQLEEQLEYKNDCDVADAWGEAKEVEFRLYVEDRIKKEQEARLRKDRQDIEQTA
jgi:hypothetical protein